ncbi:MAG TPA: ribulose-phosphate 3-epimerase [Bryobacteraceae bacterium]|nr:ribulose-phosphate 3-epimerase [Bryobacteraceae bacterium]
MVEILPSILAADFTRLGEQIAAAERGGAGRFHLDIMDGHFVPNFTIGPPVVESIRKFTKAKLDCHLMIMDPAKYAPIFIQAGADSVSIHQEICPNLDATLRLIQSEGALAGVVLNPSTPVSVLDDVLYLVDYVLIMSVNPGFGGQKFLEHSFRKVRALDARKRELGLRFPIEIDGGITLENVADAVRAGCDWIVTGTSIFHTPDPAVAVSELRKAAEGARAMIA